MILHHTSSKRFLTTLLISASIFGQSLQGRPRISAVENHSEFPADVAGYKGAGAIQSASTKEFKFPLFIPFVSITKYRDEFISGEPYFPTEALTIKTVRGRYAIWRDETGVVCAREYVPGVNRDDCIPVTLFKQGHDELSEKIIRSLALLLTITQQGEIVVTEKQ